MKTKHRFYGVEIKADTTDTTKRTFDAALSSSHLDLGNFFFKDIVQPGAFKRTMNSFKSSKSPYIPLLDSHNSRSVLSVFGTMTDGVERLTGNTLKYEKDDGSMLEVPEMFFDTSWKLDDGPDADRVLDRLRSNSIRKMSMGYDTVRDDFVMLKAHGRVRQLHEVKVGEGSLVVFPMNPRADIDGASVKSALGDVLAQLNIASLTKADKENIVEEVRALLLGTSDEPSPYKEAEAPLPTALAPDDPKRLAAEALLRDVQLRSLAIR